MALEIQALVGAETKMCLYLVHFIRIVETMSAFERVYHLHSSQSFGTDMV
jgi:hypothetical protein